MDRDKARLLKFLTELAELYKRHGLGVDPCAGMYACDIAEVKPYDPEFVTDLARDNGLGDALDYLLDQRGTVDVTERVAEDMVDVPGEA